MPLCWICHKVAQNQLVYDDRCVKIIDITLQACMQTFEKRGANFRYFTGGGEDVRANLKRI